MMLPVVILAGGLGTRLGALTGGLPKPLVDVQGQPFLAHQLQLLRRHGVKRVVLSIGHRAELIETAIGDGAAFGLQVDYVRDGDTPLGTGGAVRRAAPLLADSFFVLYGDSYLDVDYAAVQRQFEQSGDPALMVVFRNDGRWDTSNVRLADGRIIAYDKWHPAPDMAYIDYGLGVFRRQVFDALPADQPADLASIYHQLATAGTLAGFEAPQRFYEVGSPEGLAEFRAFIAGRPNKQGPETQQ